MLPTGVVSPGRMLTRRGGLGRGLVCIGVLPYVGRLGRITNAVSRSSLQPGDEVAFVGKESGYQEAMIYQFVWDVKIDVEGEAHRFGEVFETRPRRTMIVGELSKPGDSGSWVVREIPTQIRSGQASRPGQSTHELCGILFAGNGTSAWCCFIDNVMIELQRVAGAPLHLY
jgi:hypothetical protein